LINILVRDLNTKLKKSLGFDSDKIPNIKWIKRAILNLWNGEDKYGLLEKSSRDFRLSAEERLIVCGAKTISMKAE